MTALKTSLRCRSPRAFMSLGPVPPRTPGRTDAQVPSSLDDGPVRYAKLPHLYFYTEDGGTDAAFGFVDVEVSVQRLGSGRYAVELYCSADGYQSGTGSGDGEPLHLEFAADGRRAAAVAWPYPDVRSGTSDPITFRSRIDLADGDFDALDALVVPSSAAVCHVELED